MRLTFGLTTVICAALFSRCCFSSRPPDPEAVCVPYQPSCARGCLLQPEGLLDRFTSCRKQTLERILRYP